jgi:hypothetical protein
MAGDATDLKLACHENFDLVRSWRPRDHFWRIAAPVQSVEIPVRPYTPILRRLLPGGDSSTVAFQVVRR